MLLFQVVNANEDVQHAVDAGERLVDAGFSSDTAVTREQTEGLIRQLNRLDERARNRENDLETMLDKLQEFQRNHTAVLDDIVNVIIYNEVKQILLPCVCYLVLKILTLFYRLAKNFVD